MGVICFPVILEQWFSALLLQPPSRLELPAPVTAMEGAQRCYVLPCRRICSKPVMSSEPQSKGRVTSRQQKALLDCKQMIRVFTKQKPPKFSVKGCWCWTSIFEATQQMCSGAVSNKIHNFYCLVKYLNQPIWQCSPSRPLQDYFRNHCASSASFPRGWVP